MIKGAYGIHYSNSRRRELAVSFSGRPSIPPFVNFIGDSRPRRIQRRVLPVEFTLRRARKRSAEVAACYDWPYSSYHSDHSILRFHVHQGNLRRDPRGSINGASE